MSKNFNDVRIYNIDLTLTDSCNFRCKYCFEDGHFRNTFFKDIDLFKIKIKELLASDFFKGKYDALNIGLWGGEPTLAHKIVNHIVDYYANDPRVKYFIFSNGYNLDNVWESLVRFKNTFIEGGHPKFCIQMSYDGMPVHDIYRVRKDGVLTSTRVKENIFRIYDNNIPSTIKSTITLDAFKYLPAAYDDIREIYEKYMGQPFFHANNYFPTIDYYHLNKYNDAEIDEYAIDLENSLLDIAARDIKFRRKNNNQFFFAWFSPNRALCSAGRDMVCIGANSKIYKCHGSVYDDTVNDHIVTNLNDDDFIEKLAASHTLHNTDFGYQPIECLDCDAGYCLRCNPVKYEVSKKETYIERWRDYATQPILCRFYKINGRIMKALNQIVSE